jgi:hypothetical protein
VIIVILGVLVLVLWSRLSTCCSCNWDWVLWPMMTVSFVLLRQNC